MTTLKEYRDQIAEEVHEIIKLSVLEYKEKLRGDPNLLTKVISTRLHKLGEENETVYLCKLRPDRVSITVKAKTTHPVICKSCRGEGTLTNPNRPACHVCGGAGAEIKTLNFQRIFPLGLEPTPPPRTLLDEEFDFS